MCRCFCHTKHFYDFIHCIVMTDIKYFHCEFGEIVFISKFVDKIHKIIEIKIIIGSKNGTFFHLVEVVEIGNYNENMLCHALQYSV